MSKVFSWIAAIFVAGLAIVYAICPDPFPIAVDDVAAVLVAATSIGVVIKKTIASSKSKQLDAPDHN